MEIKYTQLLIPSVSVSNWKKILHTDVTLYFNRLKISVADRFTVR